MLTAATDGAVNQLCKIFSDNKDDFLPDIISGDFDSADPGILEYYKNKVINLSLF